MPLVPHGARVAVTPQVLTSRPRCAGTAAHSCLRQQSERHRKVGLPSPAAPGGNSSQNLSQLLMSNLNIFMASLCYLFSCQHCPLA